MRSPNLIEARRLSALALPVIGTQLGTMAMGVVDTLMVARLGKHELDAAALGNVWVFGTMVVLMGFVFGLDPIVSQASGARNADRLRRALTSGVAVALLTSIPMMVIWSQTYRVLVLVGQDPDLAIDAHYYALAQIPSAAPYLLFMALRQHLQGRAVVKPALWSVLIANAFNAVVNYALIFGHFGFPQLGLFGAGIATALVRIALLLALIGWAVGFKLYEKDDLRFQPEGLRWSAVWEVLRYGIPVGLMYGFEVWGFQVATLLSGGLGKNQLAAHTIVLNVAALTFMVPLGIGLGATTRIGNLIGAGKHERAQRASWVALFMGGGVMAVFGVLLIVLRRFIPMAYAADESVTALCLAIIPVAAAFQLFDGLQVVGGGVLRGMGRTLPAALFNLVGYYLLGLPLGYWLAYEHGMGLTGIWWGLAVGLLTVATCQVTWVTFAGPARTPVTVEQGVPE